MQLLVQVLTSNSRSLRDTIVNDKKLGDFSLRVSIQRKPGRKHGWAKLHSDIAGIHGAINIQWDASLRMLLCRVITRGAGKPHMVTSAFIEYLLTRFQKRIEAINILPR